MSGKAKSVIKYILTFLITAGILILLLFASVKVVPRESIRANMEKSADYLAGKIFDRNIIKDMNSSRMDTYADAILLGVAWDYDSENVVESVLWSNYYDENEYREICLFNAVTNNMPGNTQYLRYWHGSLLFVRPLLTVCDIKGILAISAALFGILICILIVLLIRKKAYISILALVFGLIGISIWFVPISLEYIWCFIIMFCTSIAVICTKKRLGMVFLITGIITSFLDFLTTETITLLVPLLLLIAVKNDHIDGDSQFKKYAKQNLLYSVLWGIGYSGMWISKWLIASVVLNINAFQYVSEHIKHRTVGDTGISLDGYSGGSLRRNIGCLFPLETGTFGKIIVIAMVCIAIYIAYVYRREKINTGKVLMYFVISLLPYVRYLVMYNHSYLHCFFTYRAQITTVMALVLMMNELTDWRSIIHANVRRRKT